MLIDGGWPILDHDDDAQDFISQSLRGREAAGPLTTTAVSGHESLQSNDAVLLWGPVLQGLWGGPERCGRYRDNVWKKTDAGVGELYL